MKITLKISLLFIMYFGIHCTIEAQITVSDYFMKSSTARNSLNPALRPKQGYLTVPLLPGVGANIQTNNINLNNLTFPGPEGKRVTFIHPSVGADQFLSNMNKDNYLLADAHIKLFGIGFYKGTTYWGIDLNTKVHADINIPKSFFGLIKKGFDRDNQTPYDLSNLTATGYGLVELGVTYARPITRRLDIGIRVKAIGGLADFDLNAKRFTIDAGPTYWEAESHATLSGSAPGVSPKYDEDDFLDGFRFGSINLPGMGAGVDFGAVYDVQDLFPILTGLKLSASVTDLGFVHWSKNNSIVLESPRTKVRITPHDYNLGGDDDANSIGDLFDDVFDDIKKAVNLKGDVRKARNRSLRTTVLLGAEYEIFHDRLSVGAVYTARFGNYFTVSEVTAIANGRMLSWLYGSFSYSFRHSDLRTFGAALHIAPKRGASLFIASDYAVPRVSSEFLPTTSKGLNLQFGISIPLGKQVN